jgi:hypothetical protein
VAKTTSSSVKAAVDLRNSALDGEPNARSGVRPKVRVSFPEMRFLNSTKKKKNGFSFLIFWLNGNQLQEELSSL